MWAHGIDDLRNPKAYKTSICHSWLNGKCSDDIVCSFAHGDGELRILPLKIDEIEDGEISEFVEPNNTNSPIKPEWITQIEPNNLSQEDTNSPINNEELEWTPISELKTIAALRQAINEQGGRASSRANKHDLLIQYEDMYLKRKL
jgi:hypothetical protein